MLTSSSNTTLGICIFFSWNRIFLQFRGSRELGKNFFLLFLNSVNSTEFTRSIEHVCILYSTWGPLPVETRGTGPPPNFRWGGGGQQWFWPPQILEVYNNSNLVNNEVFKKLTSKLASMIYHIMETLSDITC